MWWWCWWWPGGLCPGPVGTVGCWGEQPYAESIRAPWLSSRHFPQAWTDTSRACSLHPPTTPDYRSSLWRLYTLPWGINRRHPRSTETHTKTCRYTHITQYTDNRYFCTLTSGLQHIHMHTLTHIQGMLLAVIDTVPISDKHTPATHTAHPLLSTAAAALLGRCRRLTAIACLLPS